MSKTLGQQIVIQNVSGAGGTAGSTRAMRADPDGYTILMGQMGTHAASVVALSEPRLQARCRFRADRPGHLVPVADRGATRISRPNNLKEFVAYVKANQAKLNMGHAGVGSIFFTTCLLLNSILEVKPTLVPFAGGAPTMTALIAGQVDYMCGDIIVGGSPHRGRQIKIYAIASPQRNPALPDVPPTRKPGLPAFQASAWNGLFAPKGTPKPILDRLADALDKALDDDTTRKRMVQLGSDIPEKARRGQQAFLALVKSEIARWSPIIKATGITAKYVLLASLPRSGEGSAACADTLHPSPEGGEGALRALASSAGGVFLQ